jgi:hypothetical protein
VTGPLQSDVTHTVTITRVESRVASPRAALLGIVLACLAGVLAIWILARTRGPAIAAGLALATDAMISIVLAFTQREEQSKAYEWIYRAGLAALGASTGVLAYFFGSHSGFAAVSAVLVMVSGVLSAPSGPRATTAWTTFAAIALSQATVFALIAAHVLPDAALTQVLVPGHPLWHHVAAQASLQIVYLAAFVTGRVFQRRYHELVAKVNGALRSAALREALLEEARADYRRGLTRGRLDAIADVDPTIATTPAAPPAPRESAGAEPTHVVRPAPPARTAAWADAYDSKMRTFSLAMSGVCMIGGGLLLTVAKDRTALVVGLVSVTAIMVLVWAHQLLARRADSIAYWMWGVIGLLSVGPAYALGLHSGFSAVLAAWLFSSGLFSSDRAHRATLDAGVILAGIVLTHTILFTLIMLDLVPDGGAIPLRQHDLATWKTVTAHTLIMGSYATAFALAAVIDRRYEDLVAQGERAIVRAAQQAALLDTARTDLAERLASESRGIFSGTRIGRYELGRVLGRSGAGDLYAATRPGAPGRLAIKVVRQDQPAETANLRQLLREAEALRRIRSEHVAKVVDFAGPDAEVPYLVMEFIEGTSLADLLYGRERLPIADVRALSRGIGRGLHDVHAAGVLHGDVKPSNVIRGADGKWTLVDFGAAEVVGSSGVAPGRVAGAPAYLAPEQLVGEPIDRHADLYSLCLVIYRALTGRPPYTAVSAKDIAEVARKQGPPDPRLFVDVPADVALALRVGLAAWPADRFDSGAELVAVLERAFDGRLEAAHRKRAHDVLRRQPWGTA